MIRSLLLVFAGLSMASCAFFPRTPVPMKTIPLPLAGEETRCLVVLLPGRYDSPRGFVKEDFLGAAQRAGVACDFVAADANLGYYRNQTILGRLREDVFEPARAQGYRKIWLVGISLGGTGSILYALRNPGEVDGILLLAPFLGEEEIVAEVRAAGGPGRWAPPAGLDLQRDFQRAMWDFAGRLVTEPKRQPAVYLSYGASDRFAAANALFSGALQPERVFVAEGPHDWPAWKSGWEWFVASGALPKKTAAGGPG